jgi:ABC-type lipoprotein export system ATPase subunit
MTAGSTEHDVAKTSRILAQCDGVGRSYGSGRTAVHAVTDVTCSIRSLARIALTGPSGSGKSTLLNLIAGLEAPSTGEVGWPSLHKDRRGHPTGVGVVFQGPSLLSSLDVIDNVALPLLFAGEAEDTAMRRAATALSVVGIDDLARKLPGELSGGQSQRVAIARVVAVRPALILADEPTGQLDHHNGERVITVLLETANAIDAALVVATHDAVIADRFGDRWQMHDGRLDTRPQACDGSL